MQKIRYLCSRIERTRQDLVSLGVEMQTDDLTRVASEGRDFLPRFDIPQLRNLVHRSCCKNHALGIERQTNDFELVSEQSG